MTYRNRSYTGRCTDRGDNMCEFCENILPIDYVDELCDKKAKFPFREKLVLTTECGKIRFYGFNKYHYEDDSCYQNVEVIFCPICGRDLRSEENE